jgi:hypothetical protein
MLVFVLGSVAACAGLLGIEGPSEPAPGDAGDGAVPDGDGGAAEVAVGDSPSPQDSPPEGADVHEGGDEDALSDGSGAPQRIIPCGITQCMGIDVCCYTTPLMPFGCLKPSECSAQGGNPVECVGPEDCAPGQECCGGAQLTGGFFMVCTSATACNQAIACHVSTATCDCKSTPLSCLPLSTCDGRCM